VRVSVFLASYSSVRCSVVMAVL